MKNNEVTIIAGPCSIDENNVNEIVEISEFEVTDRHNRKQRAIAGTRIVGLKSRTEFNSDGRGMGMDYLAYKHNMGVLLAGGGVADFIVMPSAYIAEDIAKKTGFIIAAEIMSSIVQLPSFEGRIGQAKFIPWNSSVNQLGWHIEQIAAYSRKNGWHVGIKNGKWLGDYLDVADHEDFAGKTTMEKTWEGLVRYVGKIEQDIILIQRGVDVPEKGDFRNVPVHVVSKRVKRETGAKLYFDPSHSYGSRMRNNIPGAVIAALKIKMSEDEYLYDGVLIECGTSKTDTNQHITLRELRAVVVEVAKFRDLISPEN